MSGWYGYLSAGPTTTMDFPPSDEARRVWAARVRGVLCEKDKPLCAVCGRPLPHPEEDE